MTEDKPTGKSEHSYPQAAAPYTAASVGLFPFWVLLASNGASAWHTPDAVTTSGTVGDDPGVTARATSRIHPRRDPGDRHRRGGWAAADRPAGSATPS